MSSMRRTGMVLAAVGILAGVSLYQPAVGQLRRAVRVGKGGMVPAAPEPKEGEFSDAITLPTDRDANSLLKAANECIIEEDWMHACLALQKLLDSKEDAFYEDRKKTKGPDGKETETVRRVSLKAEANRLIGRMPPQGLEHYQLM